MIPQRIHIQNFLSHADTDIDLKDIGMAVISGKNGFGKSSIIDAILWNLFGNARGKSIDDIVKSIPNKEDNCSVEMTFLLDKQLYRVIRQRNTSNGGKTLLQFDVKTDKGIWKSLSGNGPRETQPKIESVLNMDYTTLTNSSVLIQGKADEFSNQDPAARKSVLTKILGLDFYETIASKVREKGRDLKSNVEATKIQITSKQNDVLSKDDISEAIGKSNEEISNLKICIEGNEGTLEHLRTQKEEVVKIETSLKNITSQRYIMIQDNNKRGDEINILRSRIHSMQTDIQSSDDVKECAERYKHLKQDLDDMTETRNQYAELTNKILTAQNSAGALQTRRERNVESAQSQHDKALRDLRETEKNLRLQMDGALSLSDELKTVPCNGMEIQSNCKLMGKALKAKSDLVQIQDALSTAVKCIVDFPDGPETKAWDLAIVEKDLDNPHANEEKLLQKERANLHFNTQSYTAQQELVQQFAKYPDMASKLDLLQVECTNLEKQLKEKDLQKQEVQSNIDGLNSQISALNEKAFDFLGVTEQLQSTEQALSLARRRLQDETGINARLGEKLRKISEIEAEIIALNDSLKTAEENLSLYADIATMFSKNGIQAMLIERAIPAIENEANMLLGKLTDGLSISLETQRSTGKGTIAETLDIIIYDNGGSRRYEMYSGAERFRIDIALRVALSRLVAQRAGAQIRFLCIDEGMGCLDVESLDKMLECLQIISSEFDLILVISHLEDVKNSSIFPCMINVTKDELGSHLTITQN